MPRRPRQPRRSYRTLYHIGPLPPAPKPKTVRRRREPLYLIDDATGELREAGGLSPEDFYWIRGVRQKPGLPPRRVRSGVFLTTSPISVALAHGIRGNVYAVKVSQKIIQEAGGIQIFDDAPEIVIPEKAWNEGTASGEIQLLGKVMDEASLRQQREATGEIPFWGPGRHSHPHVTHPQVRRAQRSERSELRAQRRENPMKTPADLIDDTSYEIHVRETSWEEQGIMGAPTRRIWELRVYLIDPGATSQDRARTRLVSRHAQNETLYRKLNLIVGELKAAAVTTDRDKEKSPLFFVELTKVPTGWGPLLYDIAMEYIFEQTGGGLASDAVVSPFAFEVWNKYLHNRKGDVQRTKVPDDLRIRVFGEDSCYRDELSPHSYFIEFGGKKAKAHETKCWDDPDADAMRHAFWKEYAAFLNALQGARRIQFFSDRPNLGDVAWPDEMRYERRPLIPVVG
jgi:hypothetical protein